jgi:long-chain acyl-CoA synthetase
MWDEMGRLKVIDRVKNMFKLAQGEYVAAERIETILTKHEIVQQVFVYGDSLQATLVGIVVPDPDVIKHWALSKGFSGKSVAELVMDDSFRAAIQKALQEHGKANDLKGFECLKSVYLDMTPFSVDNGLLTPTFKLKRHDAKKYYKTQIDQMYAEQQKS